MNRRTMPAIFPGLLAAAGLLAAPPLSASPFITPAQLVEAAGVRVIPVTQGLERP